MSTSEEIQELNKQIDRLERLLRGEPEPEPKAEQWVRRTFKHLSSASSQSTEALYYLGSPVGYTPNVSTRDIICDLPGFYIITNHRDVKEEEIKELTIKVYHILNPYIEKYGEELKTRSYSGTLTRSEYEKLLTDLKEVAKQYKGASVHGL